MKVYRLERKGIGPFMGRSSNPDAFYYSGSEKKRRRTAHILRQYPSLPLSDFMGLQSATVKKGGYLFGTQSKELLKAYFNFNLSYYFKDGYKIRSYEVPDEEVVILGSQVAFPVKYHNLRTVENLSRRAKLRRYR